MAFSFKKFWAGINIKAKTTSTADTKGDLEVIDSTNKLQFHNGSTVSPVVTESHTATLTNKSLTDSTVTFTDATDPTKQVKIDAGGTTATSTTISAAQTVNRTLTLPDATDTLVGKATVDTLTNKTIDANAVGNSISNLETADLAAGVLNTDTTMLGASNTQVPSALAIKTYADSIGSTADSNLNAHINDTIDAHDASAISVSPIINLTATDGQAAFAEHQDDIDDLVALSGVAANSLNLGIFTGTTIPDNSTNKSALQALETGLEAHIAATIDAHDASAISTVPVGNLAATDVQGALNELQTDIDTRATSSALTAHTDASSGVHGVTGAVVGTTDTQTLSSKALVDVSTSIVDSVDATKKILFDAAGTTATTTTLTSSQTVSRVITLPDATDTLIGKATTDTLTNKTLNSPVINTPTGITKADVGLGNVDNTSDLNKPISTATQTALNAKIEGPASSTDNRLVRFNGTTGKLAKDGSTALLSDAGVLSGLTGLTTSGDLNSTGKLVIAGITQEGSTADSTTTGANATIATPSNGILRLSNASLTSIDMIAGPLTGQNLTIINQTGNTVTINNDTGATLANRILTGTKAALTLADEASILLKYDATETRWQIIGGSGAAASGASSLDTVFQLYAEELLTTWTTGNNATFLGAGALAGTFAKETASPFNGTASYKYTQAVGSLNDYLASPAQSVPVRFRGQQVTLTLPFKYDGTTNDIEVRIYDATGAALIPSSVFIENSPTIKVFKTLITIPTTCTSIRVGFQVKVLNSTKILEFDDIQLAQGSVFVPQPLSQSIESTGSTTTFGSTNTGVPVLTISKTVGSGLLAIDSDSVSGTSFRALKKCVVNISGTGIADASGGSVFITRNETTLTAATPVNFIASTTVIANTANSVSTEVELNSGDVLRFQRGDLTTTSIRSVLLSAEALSDQILTEPETFSSDTAGLTYSSTYTLATLANAPVGTFITYTYAASSNTRTQTTTAPTQTTADMNTNGILLYTRAYNAASTAAQPAVVAIQIGKGMKGVTNSLYKSTGKSVAGALDSLVAGAFEIGIASKDYNEATGILVLDAGVCHAGATTNRNLVFVDGTGATSGYLTISASKNPALTGFNLGTVALVLRNTSGQAITSTVTQVTGWTVERDTNNAFASNQYTIPETGYYVLSGALRYAGTGMATGGMHPQFILNKNGNAFRAAEGSAYVGANEQAGVTFAATEHLVKGDVISVSTSQGNSGTRTLSTDPTQNFFMLIKRG